MKLVVEDDEGLVATITEHELSLYTMLLLRPGRIIRVHG